MEDGRKLKEIKQGECHSMNEPRLIAALQEVIDSVEVIRYPMSDRDPVMQYAEAVTPKVDRDAFERLMHVISFEEELKMFDNRKHWYLEMTHQMTYKALSYWLVNRGREVGPVEAVENLKRYVVDEKIPFVEVLALVGIEVSEGVDLGRGIRLVPFDGVPKSAQKIYFGSGGMYLGRPAATAALVCTSVLPKHHGEDPLPGYPADRRRELVDAWRILTLVGPCAPVQLASWATPEAWVPRNLFITGHSIGGSEIGPTKETVLSADKFAYAREIHELYAGLSKEMKRPIRIPLERLNQAIRRLELGDAAIDLGISFESLFLSDREPDRGELGFTLRIRVARYLKSSEQERRELARLVQRIYKIRSTAVHTGETLAEVDGIPSKQLLEQGYEVMANSIDKLIRKGIPDWPSIIFS